MLELGSTLSIKLNDSQEKEGTSAVFCSFGPGSQSAWSEHDANCAEPILDSFPIGVGRCGLVRVNYDQVVIDL